MKRGTPRHRKMRDLSERLNIPLAHAVGIMEMLWHWAATETPEGDIGTAKDREIAAAVDWTRKPEALVDALVESRWLDRDNTYRLIIHDWPQHAEHAVKKWLARKGKDFLPVYGQSISGGPLHGQTMSRQNPDIIPPSREAKAKAKAEDSVVPNNEKLSNGTQRRKFQTDFEELRLAFIECAEMQWSDPDWEESVYTWKTLDFDQKKAAIDGMRARAGTGDAALRAKPLNYLKNRMWQRSVVQKTGPRESATEREFLRRKSEREAQGHV